jgi:hypothetical protein
MGGMGMGGMGMPGMGMGGMGMMNPMMVSEPFSSLVSSMRASVPR